MAATITQQQFEEAAQQRALARQRLADLLGSDGVLALPTAPGPAPLCNSSGEQLDAFRTSLISLTCIAGLSGLPQVQLQCCCDAEGRPALHARNSPQRLCRVLEPLVTWPTLLRLPPLLPLLVLQVSLPIGTVDGLPVGLGLIGPPGSDEDLLQLTEELMGVLR